MDNRVINGSEIKEIRTINSMYANGNLEVITKDGDYLRINVDEILKLVKEKSFGLETKKVHTYMFSLDN